MFGCGAQDNLPFLLAPLVWKVMVGQPLELSDLAEIDAAAAKLIQDVRDMQPSDSPSVRVSWVLLAAVLHEWSARLTRCCSVSLLFTRSKRS